MSFTSAYSSTGVVSLNDLSGAVTLVAGTNITLTPVGNSITIDAAGGGGGGANTALSNLAAVAINTHLLPDGISPRDLGSPALPFNAIYSGLNGLTASDGSTNGYFYGGGLGADANGGTNAFYIDLLNSADPDGVTQWFTSFSTSNSPTAIESDGKLWLIAAAAPVEVRSTTFNIKDTSLASASVGYVWELQNATTGEGAWAAASGSGANTSLSNLGATAINQNLVPDGISPRSLGTIATQWSDLQVGYVQQNNASTPLGLYANSEIIAIGSYNGVVSPKLRMYDETGSNSIDLRAPLSLAATLTLTLPSIDGNSGTLLKTNGSGTLSFSTEAALKNSAAAQSYWSTNALPSLVFDGSTTDALNALGCGIIYDGDATQGGFLIATKEVSTTADTANLHVVTGKQTGSAGNTGILVLGSGTSDNGNSGNLALYTGAADNGTSGNIEFITGTGSTRGSITMDALLARMPLGTSDPAANNGGMYYNTVNHKLRLCVNGTWIDLNP